MDFTWQCRGAPTWEPGPANENEFFPIKLLYYTQKYSSVSSAVQVAGLRRSHRWRSRMWRSLAGMVTHGLRLDVLPNSLKRHWRRLMVEETTFNSLATSLVDILEVSMPIARSLKTWDLVLCDKTAHFRVAFYWCKIICAQNGRNKHCAYEPFIYLLFHETNISHVFIFLFSIDHLTHAAQQWMTYKAPLYRVVVCL